MMPISALRGLMKHRMRRSEKTNTQPAMSRKTKKQTEKGKRVLIDEDCSQEEAVASPPRKNGRALTLEEEDASDPHGSHLLSLP